MYDPTDGPRAQIARTLAEFYAELAGTKDKPAPRFSLRRVFTEMGRRNGGLDSGYEKEICSAASMIAGGEHDRNRVVIPLAAIAQRDANVAGSAGYLVGVQNLSAADVLRPWSVTARSGLTILENLRGSVTIPRVGTPPSGSWLGTETTATVDTTPVIAQAAAAPNMFGVLLEISLRFLQQAASAEDFLRTQLLRAVAKAIDQGVLAGAGGAEPTGLTQMSGIASESGTSFGWPSACNMLETLATAGLDDSRVTFVAAPGVRETLQQREVIATSGRFVWDDDRVCNRPAFATSDMPTGLMLAGDFSHCILGLWGAGLTVEINPFQDFAKGKLAARVLVACDVVTPQAGAFVKTTTVT